MDNVLGYIERFSPELRALLHDVWQALGTHVGAEAPEAGAATSADTQALLDRLHAAFRTVATFPEPPVAAVDGPVSVILCGGKGTRMRSSDKHKVCFPVQGRAAINRALAVYKECGVARHVVVVGALGEQVVAEVCREHDGVDFVYQPNPIGTGNAAKQAAHFLEALGCEGDILVVAGDKVVDPRAIRKLYTEFKERDADLAVTVAPKERWPDAGRIVFRRDGSL
ncbi:NTP transferase domain-containing protein, partial [bacterium]|nr:NTP transferase domain-containing protein [bacterium]